MNKLALVLVVALSGCAATKRSQATYRADTQRLLETRRAQIESCYATTLATDAAAKGSVTITFVVEKKTGKLTKTTADPNRSTAPEPVLTCVLGALDGLALAPPDANEGQATFTFELSPS